MLWQFRGFSLHCSRLLQGGCVAESQKCQSRVTINCQVSQSVLISILFWNASRYRPLILGFRIMVLYCLGVPSLRSVFVCPSEFTVLLGCACHLMCTHIPTNPALTLRNCDADRCTSHCTFQNKSQDMDVLCLRSNLHDRLCSEAFLVLCTA
jgi:hypothetical protein